MSSQKHSVSIYWSKGTPYKVDSYTVWTSKRSDTNIYAEQFKWGRNKERWQERISKIRNEPLKSGTDLNDITEWGVYEVNDESLN